jgi:hypothetical protein
MLVIAAMFSTKLIAFLDFLIQEDLQFANIWLSQKMFFFLVWGKFQSLCLQIYFNQLSQKIIRKSFIIFDWISGNC